MQWEFSSSVSLALGAVVVRLILTKGMDKARRCVNSVIEQQRFEVRAGMVRSCWFILLVAANRRQKSWTLREKPIQPCFMRSNPFSSGPTGCPYLC